MIWKWDSKQKDFISFSVSITSPDYGNKCFGIFRTPTSDAKGLDSGTRNQKLPKAIISLSGSIIGLVYENNS